MFKAAIMSEKSIDATIISDESSEKVRRPDCNVFVRLSVIRTEMNLLDSLRWIQKDSGGSGSAITQGNYVSNN